MESLAYVVIRCSRNFIEKNFPFLFAISKKSTTFAPSILQEVGDKTKKFNLYDSNNAK